MIAALLSDERYFDASHFALDENAAAVIHARRGFEPCRLRGFALTHSIPKPPRHSGERVKNWWESISNEQILTNKGND